MIQVYQKLNKSIVTVNPDLVVEGFDFSGKWVHMSNPTDKEIELVAGATAIPEDMIKAALDDEERARIEKEDNVLLALTDIPITEDDGDHYTYSTLPFGFISTDDVVVTVCLNETTIINDLMSGRFIKDFNIHKRTRFLLQLQYAISKKYLGKSYHVISSKGHVRDLPKSEFAVDLENNFKPKYIINPMKIKRFVPSTMVFNYYIIPSRIKVIIYSSIYQ